MPEPDLADYEAAERLVREAHARAEAAARTAAHGVPAAGWSCDERPAGAGGNRLPDVTALLALVDRARDAVPPELRRPLADALRDLLIAVRAVLDYSIERLEHPPNVQPVVEDIPIG